MGDKVRGTVTPLSESISVQDAENVARKVAEAIDTQMQQLQTLEGFADENRSLHKLLLELPDLISYNIMLEDLKLNKESSDLNCIFAALLTVYMVAQAQVPFGKVAFMPGRLIHTNELLVLLGEGYYAERSAKQAAEILTRRSDFIKTKIDGLKDQIKDLEAEASFAKDTAAEAAGGLVEIREEYMESSLQPAAEINTTETTTKKDDQEMDSDSEHSLIMARLAELEMAEEAAGEENDANDDPEEIETNLRAAFRRSLFDDSEDEEDEEDEEEEYDLDEESEEEDLDDRTAANTLLNRSSVCLTEIKEQDDEAEFQSTIIQSQHGSQDQARRQETLSVNYPAASHSEQSQERRVNFNSSIFQSQHGSLVQARGQESGGYPAATPSKIHDKSFKRVALANSPPPEQLPPMGIKASAAQLRAFTGSVMERNTEHLPPLSPAVPDDPPSRPVSRFKQRKG